MPKYGVCRVVIVMSRFVDGLLMSQLCCHASLWIYGVCQLVDVTLKSELDLWCHSVPICAAVTPAHTHTRTFRTLLHSKWLTAFAITAFTIIVCPPAVWFNIGYCLLRSYLITFIQTFRVSDFPNEIWTKDLPVTCPLHQSQNKITSRVVVSAVMLLRSLLAISSLLSFH